MRRKTYILLQNLSTKGEEGQANYFSTQIKNVEYSVTKKIMH